MLMGAIIPTLMHRIPLSPFHNQNGDGILYQTSPHKRSWKRPNKEVLLPMVLDNDECEVPMKDKRCAGLTCECAYANGCDHTNTNAPDPIRDSFRSWSGNGMCVLKPFHKWSRAGLFCNQSGDGILYQASLHKRSWKRSNKEVLLPMVLDNDECEVPMKDKRCAGLTREGFWMMHQGRKKAIRQEGASRTYSQPTKRF